MFAADRTCCVCRDRGRPTQIHHVDEDPSNNDPANLTVMCLLCHNDTQVTGGFGRKLDAHQVLQYRSDWLERVRRRRDDADALAVSVMGGTVSGGRTSRPPVTPELSLHDYVSTLPALRRRAYKSAQSGFDTGVTVEMLQAGYSIVEVHEDVLVSLANFYPVGHFDAENPRDYFSELIASRFRWHRYHIETEGQGLGGTIVGPMVVAAVLTDLEGMVIDLVTSLTLNWEASTDVALEDWKKDWLRLNDSDA